MEGISYLLMLPVVSNLVLGSIVLHRDIRDKTFRLFFTLCALVTLWGVDTLVYLDYRSLFFARLSFALGVWILTTAVFFARNYPMKQGLPTRWRVLVLGASILFSIVSFTDAVLTSFPPVVFGPLLPLYVAYFFVLFAATLATFIAQFRRASGRLRQVLLFVLLSCCLSILWGAVFDLVVPIVRGDVTYNRIGVLTAPFLTLGIAHTIIRHRLFNLQLQTQRLINLVVPVAVSATLAVAGGVLLNRSGLLLNPLLATALIIGAICLYEAVRRLFNKTWVGYALFRSTYRFHERLLKLAATASEVLDLEALVYAVKRAFTVERYFSGFGFFIVTEQAQRTWIPQEGTASDFARLAAFSDAALHQELFEHLCETGKPLVVDELPYRRPAVSLELRRALTELSGGLCIPLLVGRDLAGVLVLGARANRGTYTNEDIAVFETVSVPLAVAVTKARLLAEYQYKNGQLSREKDNLVTANEELRRIKRDFLTIVNHQLNTPLSVMQAALAMMKEGDVPLEEMRGYVESIEPKMAEFQRIVKDILDAADWEGMSADMNFALVSIDEAVQAALYDLEPLRKEKEVRLSPTLAPDLPRVMTDQAMFRAALGNLLKNACIYGARGEVELTAELTAEHRVRIAVVDHGRGFAPEEAEHIGELFFRGQGTVDYHANGSGLGVYLGKRIIEASGGVLTWQSPGPGKGATFTMELSRAKDFAPRA